MGTIGDTRDIQSGGKPYGARDRADIVPEYVTKGPFAGYGTGAREGTERHPTGGLREPRQSSSVSRIFEAF